MGNLEVISDRHLALFNIKFVCLPPFERPKSCYLNIFSWALEHKIVKLLLANLLSLTASVWTGGLPKVDLVGGIAFGLRLA